MSEVVANPGAPAVCATDPASSRGRLYAEPESASRTCFQRDRDRIVHARAFRRLQYKTQVFVYHEGDYFRTRLTHSLEVAQIARSVSRCLGLNEDLAEAVALAHDLGHTPFGHAGEDALGEMLAGEGGFDHNEQTFRILTRLEQRYAEFDGLNLTWESLEGVVKHNGPVNDPPPSVQAFCRDFDLELATYAGPEAQVAAISDDIAYNNHDIDDGLRAGLFTIADLRDIPLVGPVFEEVAERYPGLEESRLIHEVVRRLIDRMVADLVAETRRRIELLAPGSAAEVRRADRPLVAFSEEMRGNDRALKDFLFERMYRHYKVNRMTAKVRRVVQELFQQYMSQPDCLPQDWRQHARALEPAGRARLVGDYIAGMTDRYALQEHSKLFDVHAPT
ncbi:deoxyguanosinetriphosphate triphosphohydrolase [Ferruginivarius sediminum]|uniref:Deoxyguanosinetriphosphate triphosphohydrolase-like protein n=1 Tax=Ferruginivarius sediminum TaxID=2661937 RepID=A0A369TA88_9PROT|nr:deoxyguanosinetriphosphate triphosphohydrolase [Ferruginivarius sediminum]RDD61414.1 deoxyguanosinetriphosphate triphosphohydrolase [Ferruginivarius sediminum]